MKPAFSPVEAGGAIIEPPAPPAAVGYALAILVSLAVVTVKHFFLFLLEPGFLILFVAAIVVSAWYGGLGPGLLATSVCALFSGYLFLAPVGSISIEAPLDAIRLLLFIGIGVLVSGMSRGLRSAIAQAQASEARYRLLVENVREHAILLLDSRGHVATWNDACTDILGTDAGSALGEPFQNVLHGEAVPGDTLRLARESGTCRRDGWLRRGDGTRLWGSIAVHSVRDAAGRIRGYTVILRDLTERHEVGERLARLRAEHRDFVVWSSHEVSEPARSAGTLLAMLENDPAVQGHEETREILRLARANMERIKDLLQPLRTYGVLGSNPEIEDVNVDAVLDTLLEGSLAELVRERAVEVDRTALPSAGGVTAHVADVLRIGILNAILHNPGREPRIHIRGAVLPDDRREYAIEDNGEGIPEDRRELVFQAFTRGATTCREEKGAGLGLTLARRIAEDMGGSLAFTDPSRLGGACLRLELPPPPARASTLADPARAKPERARS